MPNRRRVYRGPRVYSAEPDLVGVVESWGSMALSPLEVLRLARRFCFEDSREPLAIESAALFYRFEFMSSWGNWFGRRGGSDMDAFRRGEFPASLVERFRVWYRGRELLRLEGAGETEFRPNPCEVEPTRLCLTDLL